MPIDPTANAAQAPQLTDVQKEALKRLRAASQQFEAVFVDMLFKSMREASPQTSISGGAQSPTESMFTEMLDEQRSKAIASTGSFGIAKMLENQLKEAVLANPSQAAKARVPRDSDL